MRKLALAWICIAPVFAQPAITAGTPTLEQKEGFLEKAPVVKTKAAAKGITNTLRATLSDGTITHDASIQRIDEEKAKFEGERGVEMNFRDTYKFNIAAYRLGRMLGLEKMIPPSVERHYEGKPSAFTWWVEDVIMDDAAKAKNKVTPPDKESFSRQYVIMQVFDNLIYNTDRNQQNILYDKDWHLWMIDHTRAFRIRTDLLNPKALNMCDRQLMAKMKELTFEKLMPELSRYLRDNEIRAILTRRDKIVALYSPRGETALYDYLSKQ
jgi:hypothetical protein